MQMKRFLFLLLIQFFAFYGYGQDPAVKNLVQEGIDLHDKGDFEKAIALYKKALEIDPNSSLANYEMSFSYLSMGDYKKAEKYSRTVIDLDDGNQLMAYITYGSALDLQGKTNKSIKVYEKAMKEYDNYLLYYNHAISCFSLGKIDKAYSSALKAVNSNPYHPSSHLILSKIMDRQGERIKAMLPIYFFLLLEPNTERAAIEYLNLKHYIDRGITRSVENSINIVIPSNTDSDFGAAEMMISLTGASNNLEENKGKTEIQLFIDNNNNIFKILGELKKCQTGFWWDFYVAYFYDLANENLTEVYTYYISQSQGEAVNDWFYEHPEEFDRFKNWMNK